MRPNNQLDIMPSVTFENSDTDEIDSDVSSYTDSSETTETSMKDVVMGDGGLPSITPIKVESGEAQDEQWTHLRVHPEGFLSLGEFEEWMVRSFTKFVACEEHEGKRVHYHAAILEGILKVRREWVDFKPEELKGNKFYSISEGRHVPELLKYVLKPEQNKKIVFRGFTEEEIKEISATAYAKFKKGQFKKELAKLDEQFIKREIDHTDYIQAYGNLKAMYRQDMVQAAVLVRHMVTLCFVRGDEEVISNWTETVYQMFDDLKF